MDGSKEGDENWSVYVLNREKREFHNGLNVWL
jgi:hypothetical protein